MKGLLRSNFFAVRTNAKVFSGFMLFFGIFVVAVISQSLLIGYVMTGTVGFSVNALILLKDEYTSKWGNYKLTLPVRRADIIKSLFLNQLLWMLIGMLFTGTGTGLSWLLHGCPFDQYIDTFTMFALGISMSLFMGAVFFPLFFLGGVERCEAFLIISLLCALGMDLVIVSVMNDLLEPGTVTILLGDAVLVGGSLLAFGLSYLLTVGIFKRKEY